MENIMLEIAKWFMVLYILSVMMVITVMYLDHKFSKYPNYYGYREFLYKGLTPVYNVYMLVSIIIILLKERFKESEEEHTSTKWEVSDDPEFNNDLNSDDKYITDCDATSMYPGVEFGITSKGIREVEPWRKNPLEIVSVYDLERAAEINKPYGIDPSLGFDNKIDIHQVFINAVEMFVGHRYSIDKLKEKLTSIYIYPADISITESDVTVKDNDDCWNIEIKEKHSETIIDIEIHTLNTNVADVLYITEVNVLKP